MNLLSRGILGVVLLLLSACAPHIMELQPVEGRPGTTVSLSMENLIGWPRVEIADKTLDWPKIKLLALKPERRDIPGEELVWIEDKILQFPVPEVPPGEYVITIHDDKGPPGDLVYSFLETTAYVIFPPVWPYVFRSNQTQFNFKVLPNQ